MLQLVMMKKKEMQIKHELDARTEIVTLSIAQEVMF